MIIFNQMTVKYVYKNHRRVAQVWNKKADIGTMFIVGVTILTVVAAGVAWWKLNRE